MAMDYRLAYPKKKPADDFEAGFDAYTPPAQAAPSAARPQAPQQGGQGMQPAAMGGLAAINPWLAAGAAVFDAWGGMEESERQDKLARQAEAEYKYERDKAAQEQERQREAQRLGAAFQFANYAGNERQGRHTNYDEYYRNIGL
jgi:hypothetical protein